MTRSALDDINAYLCQIDIHANTSFLKVLGPHIGAVCEILYYLGSGLIILSYFRSLVNSSLLAWGDADSLNGNGRELSDSTTEKPCEKLDFLLVLQYARQMKHYLLVALKNRLESRL